MKLSNLSSSARQQALKKIDRNTLKKVNFKGEYRKHGNKSCKCNQGHIHQSVWEATVCNNLHIVYHNELKSGKVEIETQRRFDFVVAGVKICSHYMDFLITFEGGRELAIEAKGFKESVWVIKSKLFKALYPSIEYEVRYEK